MPIPFAPPDTALGSTIQTNSLSATDDMGMDPLAPPNPFDPAKLLALFETLKKESTEYRWVWEREWLRDLYYIANRQWIFFHPTKREWVDKKMAKWVPRPVTNKMAETLQAIRTTFAAVNLNCVARPVGNDTESIAAAEIADQMAPLIHEEHLMDQVMREADFWLITCGNAVLQTSWDLDARFNKVFVPHEQCMQCGQVAPPQAVIDAGQHCPTCGSSLLQKAQGPDGKPIGQMVAFGKGKTTALSPFEYAVPPNITRFDELPYIIRLRWRDKHWFETNKPDMVNKIVWEKSPSDRSLQIFKSLALSNDIGTGGQFSYLGSGGAHTVEGVTEYELWLRPTTDYPQGLVMRIIGDKSPIVLDAQEEGIPGPLPYTDIEGNPLFPFVHAQYEHMGGRLYGRSALSPLIQKQDQLNQLDSLIQLCIQRMANPVWVVPENAGIDHFTGEPGLVMKWNPLAGGGTAKPERVAGLDVPGSLYIMREQIIKDIEDLSGAFDIIKGQKPQGVEAFSALQLLVERSQSRFTAVFQSRGEMYRKWFSLAIELERQFGPQSRTWAVIGPNRGYTFRHFENAQLQGQVTFAIEDGSNMPKTALGKRAAIEQANQLQLLDPHDPDQKFALLSNFGLSDLVPSLNVHVQSALQLQDAFEKWVDMPQGPSPLQLKPWFDAKVHWTERIKWLNTDKMREIMVQKPQVEQIVTAHLQMLQVALTPPPGAGEKPPTIAFNLKGPDLIDPQVREVFDKVTGLQPLTPPGVPPPQMPPVPPHMMPHPPQPGGNPHAAGGGQSLTNSNQQSGSTAGVPHGNAPLPNAGPGQMGPH